ncbi:MAG: cyclic nucleotide-binding domain-containing protein [Acidobacteriota bacterium]
MAGDPFKALTITYQPGERIIAAGESGACMFVVQRGNIRLSRPSSETAAIEVATLEKGDFFGEAALLDGRPYGIDAEAVTEAEVVEIGASTFQRMLRANPEIAVRLMRKMSSRLTTLESRLRHDSPAAASTTVVEAAPVRAPEPVEDDIPENTARVEELPRDAPTPVKKRSRLVVEGGGSVFPLEGTEVLLGRYDPITEIQPEIDLSTADTKRSVSRRHARLSWRGDTWYVSEEIGALNGTFVNGVKLRPGSRAPLSDNDVVSVGMVRLVYRDA